LAKQIADKSSNSFVANTEKNAKEEYKAVMTRSKRFVEDEEEESVGLRKKAIEKKGTDGKKNEVRGEKNQEKEKQIMVKKKELNDQEKEKEVEKEKENKEFEKDEKMRMKRRVEVKKAVNEDMEVPYPVVPSKKEKD